MAYWLNIGHRLFPRDAMEGSSAAPQPVLSVSTRRHISPRAAAGISPDRTGSRCNLYCRLVQPAQRAIADTAGHPLTHASTHPPHAARSSPANPFLESPADFVTRAELDKAMTSRSRTSRL